jgi:hypothetical protein
MSTSLTIVEIYTGNILLTSLRQCVLQVLLQPLPHTCRKRAAPTEDQWAVATFVLVVWLAERTVYLASQDGLCSIEFYKFLKQWGRFYQSHMHQTIIYNALQTSWQPAASHEMSNHKWRKWKDVMALSQSSVCSSRGTCDGIRMWQKVRAHFLSSSNKRVDRVLGTDTNGGI